MSHADRAESVGVTDKDFVVWVSEVFQRGVDIIDIVPGCLGEFLVVVLGDCVRALHKSLVGLLEVVVEQRVLDDFFIVDEVSDEVALHLILKSMRPLYQVALLEVTTWPHVLRRQLV